MLKMLATVLSSLTVIVASNEKIYVVKIVTIRFSTVGYSESNHYLVPHLKILFPLVFEYFDCDRFLESYRYSPGYRFLIIY